MSILHEGLELLDILTPPGATEQVIYTTDPDRPCVVTGYTFIVVERIVVVMEAGQVAEVPWARITQVDGDTTLMNLAMAESVRIDGVPE